MVQAEEELVEPASKAAMLIQANGVMIEVHPCPNEALSDGEQSLDFKKFEKLSKKLSKIKKYIDIE